MRGFISGSTNTQPRTLPRNNRESPLLNRKSILSNTLFQPDTPAMDSQPPETQDLPAIARERLQIGPAPEWKAPCSYDETFTPKLRGPVTNLLLEQQVHVELNQTYVRTAVRLETLQAVQHRSQWRLEFEPKTQSMLIHSIKIRRGSLEIEHASLERIQFLQREAGLEGFVIDGWTPDVIVAHWKMCVSGISWNTLTH